jgi:hypothetical protein
MSFVGHKQRRVRGRFFSSELRVHSYEVYFLAKGLEKVVCGTQTTARGRGFFSSELRVHSYEGCFLRWGVVHVVCGTQTTAKGTEKVVWGTQTTAGGAEKD